MIPLDHNAISTPRSGLDAVGAERLVIPDFATALWRITDAVLRGGSACRGSPTITLRIAGVCPKSSQATVLRVVDELVTNAVEHAFVGGLHATILITIDSRPVSGVRVSVTDSGIGCPQDVVVEGNGLRLLRLLGDVRVTSGAGGCTVDCHLHGGSAHRLHGTIRPLRVAA